MRISDWSSDVCSSDLLTILHPAEVELSETINLIFDKVASLDPVRVVFDSLSELRLLAQSPLRYRRQVLALKHFFAARNCTVILLDDLTASEADLQLDRKSTRLNSSH